jgi:UDP-N-acetylglucosamine:LPS N-acetylglucosamine transferase
MKLCLVASAGGHLAQLQALAKAYEGFKVCWVTSLEVGADRLRKQGTTYVVGECNRLQPLNTLRVMAHCWRLVRIERPDVVLSTGAAPGLLVCLFARLRGARIVWVDSIANTRKLSMSGRMVRPWAHLILSQWPEVAAKYPNVEYAGETL